MRRYCCLLLSLAFLAHAHRSRVSAAEHRSFAQPTPQPDAIRIEVEPERALFDRPLQIRLHGCPPGERITVRALAIDGKGEVWGSKAMFAPGNSTTLDIGQTPSLGGSYRGIDALGLFWSMAPGHRGAGFSLVTNFTITLEAELRGQIVGRTTAERLIPEHIGVRSHRIRTNGVVGDLYLPVTKERVPGLILLGGSDGEPMKERSGLLAAHGYAVLNLFYFGHDSLPKDLAKIPVEYLTNAVSWLKARELVDPGRIGVIGFSRGAEAALLTATLRSDVRVVLAVAPSSVVWPGPGASGYFHSAWSKNGEELPCVPVRFSKGLGPFLQEVTGGTQIEHRPLFEDALKNKRAVEKARIPVEQIKGAVLLISGKDDRAWPSAPMAGMVITKLRESRHAFVYRHLSYDNAGHSFGLPWLPDEDPSTKVFKMGGTPAGNAIAAVKSWAAILEFMESELRNRAAQAINTEAFAHACFLR